MIKLLIIFLLGFPHSGFCKTVKLGDSSFQNKKISFPSSQPEVRRSSISCFDNADCADNQECVALQCENVCKNSICLTGTYCIAAGQERPHEFKCVQCVIDAHCSKGLFCDTDHTCKKEDPCKNAVCPETAPYCLPEPYKTLPYTCVQCMTDEHCPPVAGLSRSCIEGNCLFNIDGNIPQKFREKVPEKTVPVEPDPVQSYGESADDYENGYDEEVSNYDGEYPDYVEEENDLYY